MRVNGRYPVTGIHPEQTMECVWRKGDYAVLVNDRGVPMVFELARGILWRSNMGGDPPHYACVEGDPDLSSTSG